MSHQTEPKVAKGWQERVDAALKECLEHGLRALEDGEPEQAYRWKCLAVVMAGIMSPTQSVVQELLLYAVKTCLRAGEVPAFDRMKPSTTMKKVSAEWERQCQDCARLAERHAECAKYKGEPDAYAAWRQAAQILRNWSGREPGAEGYLAAQYLIDCAGTDRTPHLPS
jgi:hypothetical protein